MKNITHEFQFYKWFEKEFPNFISDEGQKVLKDRADEIMRTIDNYFTPDFMERSVNAQYLREDVENVRKAYAMKDFKELGRALELFKTGCQWV